MLNREPTALLVEQHDRCVLEADELPGPLEHFGQKLLEGIVQTERTRALVKSVQRSEGLASRTSFGSQFPTSVWIHVSRDFPNALTVSTGQADRRTTLSVTLPMRT